MKSIWKYNDYLPSVPFNSRMLLGEGQTPLIRSKQIGEEIGVPELYFKLENLNPTGSYKDRFAAMFVSRLHSKSVPLCLATSSGNTGAALAAYCAAAKIRCVLAIVDGAPLAKIKQMQLYGADTYMIRDFGKDTKITNNVFRFLESTAAALDIPLPISAYRYCHEGMEAVQTISYELMEETNASINHIFSPAGGGGLTLAIARGVRAYARHRPGGPKVNCVQPEGNDTIATALRNKMSKAVAVLYSATRVSGLQVPTVLDGDAVIEECKRLKGNGYIVPDQLVFGCQRELAVKEGIFCEPAGAVALAGLKKAIEKKEVRPDEKIVCLITGSGFKDMGNVDETYQLSSPERLDNVEELKEMIYNYT